MRAGTILAAALLAAVAAPALGQEASPQARAEAFAKLPYWPGLWIPENDFTAISGLPEAFQQPPDPGKPRVNPMRINGVGAPWNAEGQRRQAERAIQTDNCKAAGWGFPMVMNAAAPIQFFITPEKVMVINGYRDVSDIRIADAHPPEDDLWSTVWGDSIGHWEGDTLVVDTIQVKNPHEYFHGAPPLSEQAHYTQRIRMTAPDRIVDEIVIEDPVTLSEPWKTTLVFVPGEGFDRIVYDGYDNDRTECGRDSSIAPALVGD